MRTRHVQAMVILLIVSGVVAVACRSGRGNVEPSARAVNLAGTRWELIALDGQEPLADTRITLTFDEEGVGGYAGCNGYGGPATWTHGGVLTITEIAMTAQACLGPEGVMAQEAAYIGALQDAATYRVTEDKLAIENTAGEPILLFKLDPSADVNPADLIDTRWQLITMNGDSPLEGSILTLYFQSENEYGGHAGCRDFIGSYEAEGDAITFYSMSMLGDDACVADEALFEQEHVYIDLISSAATYRLGEGRLEITTARGVMLVFRLSISEYQ